MKSKLKNKKQPSSLMAMPPDIRHLYTHGRLTPAEAETLGVKAMGCIECHEPVTLVTAFEPIPESELDKQILPSLVWGKDLLVMCPRCSFKQSASA
jgi:hypothetical protein